LERRQFWGFGPALARQPVLFRVADVETTPVRPGQAKVATPPAPEALRAILAGLAAPEPEMEISRGAKLAAEIDAIAQLQLHLVDERARGEREYARGKAAGIAIGITRCAFQT
jgi:hypothetical protein